MTPTSRRSARDSTTLPSIDFGHLTESARPLAELDDAARIRSIRSERWIGYPQARAVLEHLETLLSWPDRQRMPNLLLLGSTNNGKSMIIEKFRRTHPPTSLSDREQIPVLCVQMPPDPSPSRSTSPCSPPWEHRSSRTVAFRTWNDKH